MAHSLSQLGLSGFIGASLLMSSLVVPALGRINATVSNSVVSEKLAETSEELLALRMEVQK